MSGACGKRVGEVLKLFKKTLFLNGSSPSLIIERKNEWSSAVSIWGLLRGGENRKIKEEADHVYPTNHHQEDENIFIIRRCKR